MTRHLLVTCDLGWVEDGARFEGALRGAFDAVTLAPLDPDPWSRDLTTVTDWVCDPAPRYRIDGALVDAQLPALARIASPSTGTTHIDGALAHRLTVRCLRDVPPDDLARITSSSEHTFFLYLALMRRAKHVLGANLAEWRDDLPRFRGRQVAGRRVLVLGHGRIGSNLGRYLTAFGAEVTFHDPDPAKHVPDYPFVPRSGLRSAVAKADAVFLCYHWSRENEGFFDAGLLDAMRDDAVLVNTSRGENLDEAHLTRLLAAGKFAGVALDVLRDEQTVDFADHPIVAMARTEERLIVSPHIAGASYDSERLAFEMILATIAPSG
jgi:D-3-phosphoglycerate dehydrogenase